MQTPSTCPSCGAPLAAGASQCRACKRVFGDDNRCPHCEAFAPARWNGVELSCSACGKPRERKPQTVVIEEKGGSGEALTVKAGSVVLQGAGFVGFGLAGLTVLGVTISSLAGGGPSAEMILAGGVMTAIWSTLGFFALRSGRRIGRGVARRDRASTELRVLSLAEQSGGVLTVTEAVRGLGLASADAESLLTSLVDGSRVTMEVDGNGVISYHFRELQRALPAQRVRVELAETAEVDAVTREEAERRRRQ